MEVTDVMRGYVGGRLGRDVEDWELQVAVSRNACVSGSLLKLEHDELQLVFEAAGGRGVELADRLDELRIVLALRELSGSFVS